MDIINQFVKLNREKLKAIPKEQKKKKRTLNKNRFVSAFEIEEETDLNSKELVDA